MGVYHGFIRNGFSIAVLVNWRFIIVVPYKTKTNRTIMQYCTSNTPEVMPISWY